MIKHLSSYGHVIHTTANQVISRCRKNENICEMSKMKTAHAKRAKLLFFTIKYANLRRSCCCRSHGCVSSLILRRCFKSVSFRLKSKLSKKSAYWNNHIILSSSSCQTKVTAYQVKPCPWPDIWQASTKNLFPGLERLVKLTGRDKTSVHHRHVSARHRHTVCACYSNFIIDSNMMYINDNRTQCPYSSLSLVTWALLHWEVSLCLTHTGWPNWGICRSPDFCCSLHHKFSDNMYLSKSFKSSKLPIWSQ